jgi:hypothetical protein
MLNNTMKSLAFAAGCALALGAMPAAQAQTNGPQVAAIPQVETNGPQASQGDYGGWSAQRNVIESQQYDRLLQTSRGFRQARMNKECGPITDPQLHDQCMASFSQYEPPAGPAVAPRS